MDRVRLVIFDWDGTLADSAAQIVAAMQAAIESLGLPARGDEAIRELIGLSLDDGMRRLYPELEPAWVNRLLDGYRARWLADRGAGGEAPLFDGALEAVEALCDAGFSVAIATGKSRRGLDRSLRHHQALNRWVVNSRCADETASKPDPLMLRELLRDARLAPEQALMIGDTEYDAAMAQAIGMPALGVACGVHLPERILRAGARDAVAGVHAVPDWLTRRGGGGGTQGSSS